MFYSSHLFTIVIFIVIYCATVGVSNLRNEISISSNKNEILDQDFDYNEVEHDYDYEAQHYKNVDNDLICFIKLSYFALKFLKKFKKTLIFLKIIKVYLISWLFLLLPIPIINIPQETTSTTTVGTTTPMGECCACPTTPTTTTTTTTTQRPTQPTTPTVPTPSTPTTPTIPTVPTTPTTTTTTPRPIIITCPAGQCAVCAPCRRFKNKIANKYKFYNETKNSSIFMNIKNGKYLEF